MKYEWYDKYEMNEWLDWMVYFSDYMQYNIGFIVIILLGHYITLSLEASMAYSRNIGASVDS